MSNRRCFNPRRTGALGGDGVNRAAARSNAMHLIFGLALGPCTFAFMAPVLAVTFSLAATDWWYAMALLLVYGIGHCLVIAIAGGATGLVQRYLAWSEDSSGALWMKRACGLLVALAGLYMLWTAP